MKKNNVAQKHNAIIFSIERKVNMENMSAKEIAEAVAAENGMSVRDLSVVFSYLMDTTLYAYITSRKLMKSYTILLRNDWCDMQMAIYFSGYSDQPSFTKAFKRMFDVTPKQAVQDKDLSKVVPPLTWERLGVDSPHFYLMEEDAMDTNTVFGVSKERFEKMQQAMELESFYGFSHVYSNYAYELAESKGYSLEDTFKYTNSLKEVWDFYIEGKKGFSALSPAERLHEVGDEEIYQKVFFERGLSVAVIDELVDKYGATLEELLKCDMRMLNEFPGFDAHLEMSFSFYVRAYEYYMENAFAEVEEEDEVFYEYITELLSGMPMEEALDLAENLRSYDDDMNDLIKLGSYEDPNEEARYLELERLHWEQFGGTRIDDDLYYDEDNPGFEAYDKGWSGSFLELDKISESGFGVYENESFEDEDLSD